MKKIFESVGVIIMALVPVFSFADSGAIIAFKNVNLVPMTDAKILANQTVLIKGNRIFKIGPAASITVPRHAKVIDGKGAFLMPGMADMHVL